MSTILAYTSPARGHLYPMMDVLLELRRRGHDVVVQTLASEAERTRAAGLGHRAISAAIEAIELHDFAAKTPVHGMKIAIDTWLRRAPREIADLERAVAEVRPDLLLIDANTFGASIFAEGAGLPWALHMPYCLPTSSVDAPMFGPGFAPASSAFGRARDAMVRAVVDRAIAAEVRRLNALRRAHGVRELGRFEEIYDAPPRILYRTAEPFEYARSDWHANVSPIGPGLWAPEGDLPQWVTDLPEPRVLVSISTEAQRDGAIISTALAALAEEPGSVICTTAAEDPEQFQCHRPNVKICRFLSHAEVLPYVDCVVTHGGMGTVQRALAARVPLVVVPWGRDQNESAQRVVAAGAGVRLNPGRLTPKALREAVRSALAKADGAGRVADAFAAAGGASRGADLVERELAVRTSAAA